MRYQQPFTAMNKLNDLLFIFLLLISMKGFCQSHDEDSLNTRYLFPDTIKFIEGSFYHIKSLDCVNAQLIDTVKLPDVPSWAGCFVYYSDLPALLIAFKDDNMYNVFQFRFERDISSYNFNKPELITFYASDKDEDDILIKWTKSSDTQNRDGSDHIIEYYEGFMLLDLSKARLATFINYDYRSFDKMESSDGTTLSALVEYCDNFIPSIRKEEITFTESNNCNKNGVNIKNNLKKSSIIKYKLQSSTLIKVGG